MTHTILAVRSAILATAWLLVVDGDGVGIWHYWKIKLEQFGFQVLITNVKKISNILAVST